MRSSKTLVLGFVCACWISPSNVGWSQDEGQATPMFEERAAREYELKHMDGSGSSGTYDYNVRYYFAPGWAKPRRMTSGGGVNGTGQANFSLRSGQSRDRSLPAGAPGLQFASGSVKTFPIGGLIIDAVVLKKSEDEKHAQVIVGHSPGTGLASMSSSEGSMGMGSMGSPSGMMGGGYGSAGGAIPRYGDSAMGGEGMSAGGDMSSALPMLPGKLVIIPLDELYTAQKGLMAYGLQLSASQLKNLIELVRVDCWIEEELAMLRSSGKDADKSKATENELKELLNKEYELQLNKQREDIERLAEKLKTLQAELARRAAAQERVIEVQLGQLVLEAQGLIGERP